MAILINDLMSQATIQGLLDGASDGEVMVFGHDLSHFEGHQKAMGVVLAKHPAHAARVAPAGAESNFVPVGQRMERFA